MLSIYKFVLLMSDLFLVTLSLALALLLGFEGVVPSNLQTLFIDQHIILALIFLAFNVGFRSYQCMLKYISSRELMYLLAANTCGMVTFMLYGYQTQAVFPYSTYFICGCFIILFSIISRFSYQFIHRAFRKFLKNYQSLQAYINKTTVSRTLLIGAGDAAAILINENKKHPRSTYNIVIAVDDDKSKHHSYLNGIPVRGPISNLPALIVRYKVTDIVIAIPSISKSRLSEIITLCHTTKVPFKIFPGVLSPLDTTTSNQSYSKQIRKVRIEDLLGREEIILHNTKLTDILHTRTILVTGGGGSIGSELCRQIAAYKPHQLIIFDIYENNAYDLQNELLQNGFSPECLKVIIGSVRDQNRLEEVFTTYKPHIVFHAAAHKHVPLMENNPGEAIKNNVFGTFNVALCAKKHRTKKFILISTDKAVNPTNVMGATKRLCEMIVQSLNATTVYTQFVAVRFGNVLGSNGSVIPLFKNQIEKGGPLTVTHPDITRYFMTIPEAVRLILQATSFAKGGEIFILDMGERVKILDLAYNFIRLSGLEPEKDIEIKFSGLRPGEKLYEELLMSEEGMSATAHEKIFIAKPLDMDFKTITQSVKLLENALQQHLDIPTILSQIVPTYKYSPNGCYDQPTKKERPKIS